MMKSFIVRAASASLFLLCPDSACGLALLQQLGQRTQTQKPRNTAQADKKAWEREKELRQKVGKGARNSHSEKHKKDRWLAERMLYEFEHDLLAGNRTRDTHTRLANEVHIELTFGCRKSGGGEQYSDALCADDSKTGDGLPWLRHTTEAQEEQWRKDEIDVDKLKRWARTRSVLWPNGEVVGYVPKYGKYEAPAYMVEFTFVKLQGKEKDIKKKHKTNAKRDAKKKKEQKKRQKNQEPEVVIVPAAALTVDWDFAWSGRDVKKGKKEKHGGADSDNPFRIAEEEGGGGKGWRSKLAALNENLKKKLHLR
mmetsp:Transcript_1897/g.4377  ORF Transcript_1897/g.4377 Transcript_1897/m.4377 type:complete len:310 (-) Transcript_1897:384-1313(-)